MTSLLRSLLRIAAATIIGLIVITSVAALLIRQPTATGLSYDAAIHADARRLERDVAYLTADVSPRNAAHPENLDRAADWIGASFKASGATVEQQRFTARGRQWRNVIAHFGPAQSTAIPVVVGAHYDAFGETGAWPGADDNASGTAGLLELAVMLGRLPPSSPVVLVAFTNEEPPFFGSEQMGSAVHAESLAIRDHRRGRMICLEMIGYFAPQQAMPSPLLGLLYPPHGDFVAVAGGWSDVGLTRLVKRAMAGSGDLPVVSFTGPHEMSGASDQRNYWSRGWEAVMVTDTAFLRNPNYHTARDTAGTLDYAKMAGVVDGVLNAMRWAAR